MSDQPRRVPRRLAIPVAIAFVIAAAIIGHTLGSSAAPRPGTAAGVAPSPVAKATHAAAAGDPIYLSLSGIMGESTAAGYANSIEVESWSWGASNPGSLSRPSFNSAVVTFPLNRAIPPLVARLLSHQRIATASLAFVKNVGDRALPYLQMTFTDVLVTNWSEASDGQVPTEQLSFTFQRVQYTYDYQGLTGTSTPYQFCWALAGKAAC